MPVPPDQVAACEFQRITPREWTRSKFKFPWGTTWISNDAAWMPSTSPGLNGLALRWMVQASPNTPLLLLWTVLASALRTNGLGLTWSVTMPLSGLTLLWNVIPLGLPALSAADVQKPAQAVTKP